MDFVQYELEEPKYDTEECRQRGITYAAPMRVTLRLIVFEVDQDTETRSVLDIKEQDVYMGDMPHMTHSGTLIINGTIPNATLQIKATLRPKSEAHTSELQSLLRTPSADFGWKKHKPQYIPPQYHPVTQ